MVSPAELEEVLNQPAAKPPPGVKSNFKDAANRNVQMAIGIFTAMAIVTVFTALHAFKRISQAKKLFLDDCLYPSVLHSTSTDVSRSDNRILGMLLVLIKSKWGFS